MKLPKKYKIGELAKMLNVATTTLKYWAERGYIPQPHRDNSLQRRRWWSEEEAQIIAEYKSKYYQY